MQKNDSISFSISYDAGKLSDIREELLSFLNRKGIDVDIISEIDLSSYEALVNIIEHSTIENRGGKITLECYITEDRVEINIENIGEKFDITSVELPDIREHFKEGKKRGEKIIRVSPFLKIENGEAIGFDCYKSKAITLEREAIEL